MNCLALRYTRYTDYTGRISIQYGKATGNFNALMHAVKIGMWFLFFKRRETPWAPLSSFPYFHLHCAYPAYGKPGGYTTTKASLRGLARNARVLETFSFGDALRKPAIWKSECARGKFKQKFRHGRPWSSFILRRRSRKKNETKMRKLRKCPCRLCLQAEVRLV